MAQTGSLTFCNAGLNACSCGGLTILPSKAGAAILRPSGDQAGVWGDDHQAGLANRGGGRVSGLIHRRDLPRLRLRYQVDAERQGDEAGQSQKQGQADEGAEQPGIAQERGRRR